MRKCSDKEPSYVCGLLFLFARNVHKVLSSWKEEESKNMRQIICLQFILLTLSWWHRTVVSLALCGFFSVCLLGADGTVLPNYTQALHSHSNRSVSHRNRAMPNCCCERQESTTPAEPWAKGEERTRDPAAHRGLPFLAAVSLLVPAEVLT